ITTISSEVLELREQLASLQALLNKSVAFDVVVSPKRTKGFKWTVNIEHATLDGLKEHIHLREMLQLFVSKNNLKFTVFIETPSKAFSEDPSMAVFPTFSCGNVKPSQESLAGLMAELKSRLDNTPINLLSIEATKSIYVYSKNGGQKKMILLKGVAQCAVQLESSLSNRKRKADEIEEDQMLGRVFGIATDAEKFYFMECTLDDQDRPSFKPSEPVVVVNNNENMKTMV
ncbi:648_t:CDS:2, partial [Funneliformis caledonium]